MDQIEYKFLPMTPEFSKLKLELYNSLNTMTIAKCKYPKRIEESHLPLARVVNFGAGLRRWRGYDSFKANDKYPMVWKKIQEFASEILPPDFKYTICTVNRDTLMKKHLDSNNVGKSYLVCLGDYNGGGLYIYDNDGKKTLYDTHNTMLHFNGSDYAHETQPFVGRRYTLIFYSQGLRYRFGKTPGKTKEELDEIEEIVQTSLAHSIIDESLDKLKWDKKGIENSLTSKRIVTFD